MLKNYLKIVFKVLRKRLFFTFVSLFGISFTLMVLMVFTAMCEHVMSPGGAERDHDRFLLIETLVKRSPDRSNSWSGGGSLMFFDEYIRPMETPAAVAVFGTPTLAISYQTGRKLALKLKRTDAHFWRVLAFQILEGRAINAEDVAARRFVAVINESTRRRVFGEGEALGRELRLDRQVYTVIGVVADVSNIQHTAFSEVWAPIGTSNFQETPGELIGEFNAILLANRPADFSGIKNELRGILRRVEFPDPNEWNQLLTHADTRMENLARTLFNETERDVEASVASMLLLGGCLMVLFMLLPSVNLINLNISRIAERAGEIGVRKAFGASSLDLVFQFLLENLILTFVGGVLGFIGAWLVLHALSSSGLIPYAVFQIHWSAFGWGLALVLVFGLFSGVYPAWKMSRLHPVAALRRVGA